MKKWYQQLNQNEQRLIHLGVPLVLLALFWSLVYVPMNEKIENQVNVKNRLLVQMSEMNSWSLTVNNTPAKNPAIPVNTTFSIWLDQQLSQIGLQELVNRTEPVDANTLTVWLNNAPFDKLIDWVQNIRDNYAVQVDQIDVNVTDRSLGYTNIRMRLVRK